MWPLVSALTRVARRIDPELWKQYNVRVPTQYNDCWLIPYLDGVRAPTEGNPIKDNIPFIVVQHQKTAWLAEAATRTNADVLTWIDFGIFHVHTGEDYPQPEDVFEFVKRIDGSQQVAMPGSAFTPKLEDITSFSPESARFRFCGTVIVCPRRWAIALHQQMSQIALAVIRGTLTFESNVWALAECYGFPIRHYPIYQWGKELLTNYSCSTQ